eukprot:12002622-Alexandrium_andersonii.AAC.1
MRPPARFVNRFGTCSKSGAECTPPELQGPTLRPLLGSRSSRFERLERFSHFPFNGGATRFDRFDSLLGSI